MKKAAGRHEPGLPGHWAVRQLDGVLSEPMTQELPNSSHAPGSPDEATATVFRQS